MNWENLVYTVQDQLFKIQILNLWTNWERTCPNLIFAVENKMGNLHKKRILNLTEIIKIFHLLKFKNVSVSWEKRIFHWEKWNEPIGNSECFVKKP